MNNMTKKILPAILILFVFQLNGFAQETRIEKDFNTDWKFISTDIPEAANADFDDSAWRKLDVPHEWAFEKGVSKNGAQGDSGGYFDGGLGWYRKNFEVPANWSDKIVNIQFDGVYMNSEVWINGHYLGKRPYGYISFRYELSEYLKPGENIISVRVDNSKEPSARWYHPCGIYAPVHLVVTNRRFIAPNGIYITTPKIDVKSATVQIQTTLENRSGSKAKTILETSIVNSAGIVVAKSSQPVKWDNNKLQLDNKLELENPELWSPNSPYLYKVVNRLLVKKKVVDEVQTNIGIRSIEWNLETGFLLNGKSTKLLGVCEHYEGGPFGGAWTKPWLVWKLSLLKEMGVNAVRTAHNPAPPMFYDVCDELGIMVMDEVFDGWKRKAKMDYGEQAFNEWWKRDITEWIMRNRNHPSIIIYSLGNETSGEIAKDLVETCHQLDITRPITSGHSASEEMDVFGVNGGSEKVGFYKKKAS